MNYNTAIGKKIKKTRTAMGLSQKKFGTKVGVSGSFVGYLENGTKRVNPNLLKKISLLTNHPVSYFYGEKLKLDKTLEVFNILLKEKDTPKRKKRNT